MHFSKCIKITLSHLHLFLSCTGDSKKDAMRSKKTHVIFNRQEGGERRVAKKVLCGNNQLTFRMNVCQMDRKKESLWKIISDDLDMSEN